MVLDRSCRGRDIERFGICAGLGMKCVLDLGVSTEVPDFGCQVSHAVAQVSGLGYKCDLDPDLPSWDRRRAFGGCFYPGIHESSVRSPT